MSEKKKSRWIARVLDRNTVRSTAPWTWVLWRKTTDVFRGQGYRQGQKPPDSGDLLVQSPYADWYNLTWGLAPNQDMPKWRWMYRARPEVRRGVDLKVILAVGRGFSVVVKEDDEIEAYITRLVDHLNIKDVLQSAVSDMQVYGQAYFEKVRTTASDEQEQEKEELAPIESRVGASLQMNRQLWPKDSLDIDEQKNPREAISALKDWQHDVQEVDRWLAEEKTQRGLEQMDFVRKQRYNSMMKRVNKKGKVLYEAAKMMVQQPDTLGGQELRDTEFQKPEGELVELKSLDPLWMRMNRDAFGNIVGFVQWGLTPIPQSILMEKLVYLRWMPKSWAQENAYGTSVLMPVQRHVSMLIQAEEDMKIWFHQYARPMLHVKAGTPEKPYPAPALQSLQSKFSARQNNTDAITPGDVDVKVIQGGTSETAKTFEVWEKYLREKIYETLGIPDVLMNLPGEMTRATSDVTLQAFIAEERMIQELIAEQLLRQVIEPEVRRHFQSKYPDGAIPTIKIIWSPILEEDRNKKIDRLIKSVGTPFETINEARSEANLEPLDGEEYDTVATMATLAMGGSTSSPTAPSKNPEQSETTRTGPREEQLQKRDRSVASIQYQRQIDGRLKRLYEDIYSSIQVDIR